MPTLMLDGSRIVSESWDNILIIYLYDESGSPVGMQYRTTSMAENTFYTFYFEKNLQGDIVAVYTESGVKVVGYTYDAWGNFTTTYYSTVGTNWYAVNNPFRYRGYYYDSETGLYYLQSRYYNPQWGRFISADAYVSTGTGLLGYNMYAYCNNNPVMYVDPTGEVWISILVVTLVGVGLLSLSSCSGGGRGNYEKAEFPGGEYEMFEDALSDAYDQVYENGKASGHEYAAVIYMNKYEPNMYRIFDVYTDHSPISVKYRDLHGVKNDPKSEWIAIADVHYHPTGGDSTCLSPEDLGVARDHQIAMFAINASGAKADPPSYRYLYARKDKPFYMRRWDQIHEYIP